VQIYRVPRRAIAVHVRLDDGRTVDGALFTPLTGMHGGPEELLGRVNDDSEEFVPLMGEEDSVLLNKGRIVWIRLAEDHASDLRAEEGFGRPVSVRMTLTGGETLSGVLSIVMPAERNRVVDFLNAPGRFFPLFAEDGVTLVHKGFVASVASVSGWEPR
jgi:hypothetical protein